MTVRCSRRAVLLAPALASLRGRAALSGPAAAAAQDAAVPQVALGVFVPGSPADPKPLEAFAERIGRMPAFVHWYEAWGSADAVTGRTVDLALLDAVTERGAAPMITWEPWDPKGGANQAAYRPAVIAAGAFDAYIDAWAARLASWKRPVFLRVFHELNAEWYPWGAAMGRNAPEDLVAAWRHLHARFDAAGADNVRWVWCPDAGLGKVSLASLFPGDDVVDWVALDGYNWGDNHPESGWRSFDEIFGTAYRALARLSERPVMIAETASSERGGDKAAWIADAVAALPERFSRVRAIGWFDERLPDGDFPVDTSEASVAAFREAAALPWMQGALE